MWPTAAVYDAAKQAVRAISDGLRQESPALRVTCIHLGVVEGEPASTITDPVAAEAMRTYRSTALEPDAIACTVRFAIEQPEDVDVNEIVVRPTAPHRGRRVPTLACGPRPADTSSTGGSRSRAWTSS